MKNENSTKVFNTIKIIGVALALVCVTGEIIALNTGASIPTKLSESIWCSNLILWIGIFLMADHRADTWEENYDRLNNEYIKLLEISKEINDISVEQNKLCKDIQANNRELISGWSKSLDENKRLLDERRELIAVITEFDPQHPLVKESLKNLNGDVSEKEASSAISE